MFGSFILLVALSIYHFLWTAVAESVRYTVPLRHGSHSAKESNSPRGFDSPFP